VSRLSAGERRLLTLAVASQASISIASWGLGALGPELQEEFGLSNAGLGAVLAAGFIGNAIILVPAGTLVDRAGPRRPLVVGGLLAGAALVSAGLAPSVWLVGVALFLYGLTAAFVAVAGTVSIFHGFDAARRGIALGFRQMAVSAGGLVAAALLPGLAAIGGVRLAFVVSGVLAAGFATAFGLSSPGGALHEPRAGRGIDVRGLLSAPGLGRVVLISLIHVTALTTVLNFAVPAIRAEGASTVVGSALFAVISLSAMVARLAWGHRADRHGGSARRAALRDVGLITLAGAVLYWLVAPHGAAISLVVMVVFAFGAMGANGVLYLIAGELVGPQRAGQAVGLVSMALFGGSAVVSPALGALADSQGFRSLWIVAAVCACLTVVLTRGIPTGSTAVADTGQSS
jgi:MFS family permease